MDRAGAVFPASAALFKPSALGVYRPPGFALFAVAAVELQRHNFALKTRRNHNTHCTLLHAGREEIS